MAEFHRDYFSQDKIDKTILRTREKSIIEWNNKDEDRYTFPPLWASRLNVVAFLPAGAGLPFLRLRPFAVAVGDNIHILLRMADGAYAFHGSRVLATERAGRAPLPITDHPSGINVIYLSTFHPFLDRSRNADVYPSHHQKWTRISSTFSTWCVYANFILICNKRWNNTFYFTREEIVEI